MIIGPHKSDIGIIKSVAMFIKLFEILINFSPILSPYIIVMFL